MANPTTQGNVADLGYPGKVLDPNNPDDFVPNDNLEANQFGEELPKPGQQQRDAVQVDEKGIPTDPTLRGRYEFHQSRADKAEAALQKAMAELQKLKPMEPLMNVISEDEEVRSFIKTRLNGGPKEKPLEPPQRPSNYNEVEAFSNPESDSFKYRQAMDRYRDEKIVQLEQSNKRQFEEQQRALEQERISQARQRQLAEYQREIFELGITQEQLPEFLNLMRTATPKDQVEFFNWKMGMSQRSSYPINPGTGFPMRPQAQPAHSGPIDVGKEILELSRTIY